MIVVIDKHGNERRHATLEEAMAWGLANNPEFVGLSRYPPPDYRRKTMADDPKMVDPPVGMKDKELIEAIESNMEIIELLMGGNIEHTQTILAELQRRAAIQPLAKK